MLKYVHMNSIQKYVKYYKDNPEGYWFKRKLYGWGWVPVKWQGWLTLLFFVAFLLWNGFDLSLKTVEPSTEDINWFFIKLALAIVLLIIICYRKGERPKWQWGLPEDDIGEKPEEIK